MVGFRRNWPNRRPRHSPPQASQLTSAERSKQARGTQRGRQRAAANSTTAILTHSSTRVGPAHCSPLLLCCSPVRLPPPVAMGLAFSKFWGRMFGKVHSSSSSNSTQMNGRQRPASPRLLAPSVAALVAGLFPPPNSESAQLADATGSNRIGVQQRRIVSVESQPRCGAAAASSDAAATTAMAGRFGFIRAQRRREIRFGPFSRRFDFADAVVVPSPCCSLPPPVCRSPPLLSCVCRLCVSPVCVVVSLFCRRRCVS